MRLNSNRLAAVAAVTTAVLLSLAIFAPANAQFWNEWGGRQQRQNGWGWGGGDRGGWGWDNNRGYQQPQQQAPVDYSRAPAATPRKEASTTSIVVLGDAMADWLAYGLEDAYTEKPDIGIVRKHRTDSGLIRYDQRRDSEWPQVIREIIAAEKPKFIVMMIGNNDRQQIREKQPAPVRPGTPGAAKAATPQTQQPTQAAPQTPAQPKPEVQQDAELQQEPAAEPVPVPTTEQARQALYGPWEFHT